MNRPPARQSVHIEKNTPKWSLPKQKENGDGGSCHHNFLSEAKFSSIEVRNDQRQDHQDKRGCRTKGRIARVQELPLNEIPHQDDLPPAENIRNNERAHHWNEYENGARHDSWHRQWKCDAQERLDCICT